MSGQMHNRTNHDVKYTEIKKNSLKVLILIHIHTIKHYSFTEEYPGTSLEIPQYPPNTAPKPSGETCKSMISSTHVPLACSTSLVTACGINNQPDPDPACLIAYSRETGPSVAPRKASSKEVSRQTCASTLLLQNNTLLQLIITHPKESFLLVPSFGLITQQ